MLLTEAFPVPNIYGTTASFEEGVRLAPVPRVANTFYYAAETEFSFSPRVMERNGHKDARKQIDECADRIYALAKLLELADHLDSLNPKIDPQAVAQAGKMISGEICILISLLDELSNRARFRR